MVKINIIIIKMKKKKIHTMLQDFSNCQWYLEVLLTY